MYLYLATAILSMALAGFGVWKVQDWRHDSQQMAEKAAADEKRRMDAKMGDNASVGHEQDKVKLQTKFITINEKVEHVTSTPFYVASELCLDADGLRELNAARAPDTAASQPAPTLPGLKPSRWWQPSR